MTTKCHLYTRTLNGHRGAYLAFARAQFNGEQTHKLGILLAREPVLFLMVGEDFLGYVICALVRAVVKRRAVGLLFRPEPALAAKSVRLKLKKYILRLLMRVPHVRVFGWQEYTLVEGGVNK